MTRQRRTLCLTLGGALLLPAVTFLLLRSAEPRFEGKTARQWIRRTYLKDFIHTTPLHGALSAIGPSHAVTAIIDELDARPVTAYRGYATFFNKMPSMIQKAFPRPVSMTDYRFWVDDVLSRYETKDLKPALPALL